MKRLSSKVANKKQAQPMHHNGSRRMFVGLKLLGNHGPEVLLNIILGVPSGALLYTKE